MNGIWSKAGTAARTLPLGFWLLTPLCALVFAVLPGGWWFTMGGGMRWQWGYPIPFFVVQGKSPFRGYRGFGDFNYGPGYFGLLADWLIWTGVFLCVSFAAQLLSKKAHGRIGSQFVFVVFISGFAAAYGLIYKEIWTTFLLNIYAG
jgi:hypothetical protein